MAILRTILWSAGEARAAADPRVQKKAGQAFRAVDGKMGKAADKVADVAIRQGSPRARWARCSARSSRESSGRSADRSPSPVHLVRSKRTRTSTGLPPLAPEASASTNSATTARSDGAAERTSNLHGVAPTAPSTLRVLPVSATAARCPPPEGRAVRRKQGKALPCQATIGEAVTGGPCGRPRPRGLKGRASRPPIASSTDAPR